MRRVARMTTTAWAGLALALLAMSPACAADVEITQAWARATAGAAGTGVVYLTVANHGAATAVIGAEAPIARRASLHTHRMDGDVMRMRPVEDITLPAGARVTLQPGGLHIMLMGLADPLVEGDGFPLTLHLANGSSVVATVAVGSIGALEPPDHGGH